jgi:hypothetical protein
MTQLEGNFWVLEEISAVYQKLSSPSFREEVPSSQRLRKHSNMQIIHSPFLIGPFHFDFGYVRRLLVEIARGKLQKRFTVRLFDDGSFDDERPNVLEEVTFMLVLEL